MKGLLESGQSLPEELTKLSSQRIDLYLNPEFPVYINPSTSQWLRLSNPVADDLLSAFQIFVCLAVLHWKFVLIEIDRTNRESFFLL